jgi:hypothetical protein
VTRRLRWVAFGALLGAVGYRRLARAIRPWGRPGSPSLFGCARLASRALPDAGAFARDVRAGAREYLDVHGGSGATGAQIIGRRPAPAGNTLVGQTRSDTPKDGR